MATSRSRPAAAQFDEFEVDFASKELRKWGERVPVQDQPFQVLRLLLEAEGRVVMFVPQGARVKRHRARLGLVLGRFCANGCRKERVLMAVFVKIEYQDELAVVKSGVRAETKNGKLSVLDAQGSTVASFAESKVLHWWVGDIQDDKLKQAKVAEESF